MSNNQVVIFDAPQFSAALLSQAALSLGGALTGGLGSGINRISLKGNRFRLVQAGQEVAVLDQSVLDVVIVGSTPSVSRIYYKEKYSGGEKVKPTCWSKDGIKPDANVPPEVKQGATCASCQQNIKGSAVGDNGVQSRACAFRKRIAVVAPNQLNAGDTPEVYALDVNALSLFGDGDPGRNHFGLGGYGKFLKTPRAGFPTGIPPIAVITRLSLDSNSSVPKLFFGVAANESGRAAFLDERQLNAAIQLSKSEDVSRLIDIAADELLAPEATAVEYVAPPAIQPVAKKVQTWQAVAAEAGADEDDIELIESAGGPYTEKGRKRWDKVVDVEPPVDAAPGKPKTPRAAKPVVDEPKATPAAPVVVVAPTKPQGVSAAVGAKLADALAGFDDE